MPRSLEENVNLYFDRAAALTDHPRSLLDHIRACDGVYAVQFPVSHPDGRIEVVRGWRATQPSPAPDQAFAYSAKVDESSQSAPSLMTYKCGGRRAVRRRQGAVQVDPHGRSAELERITRRYTSW
jgi:glutamate dehydrogenase (NAD(P)+)